MSDDPPFKITRIPPRSPPRRPVVPDPTPPRQPIPPPRVDPPLPRRPPGPAGDASVRPSIRSRSRSLFVDALSTLLFLGCLHTARRPFEFDLYHGMASGWLVGVDLDRGDIESFVRLASGLSYETPSGVSREGGADGWKEATLEDLLMAVRLPAGPMRGGAHVLVALPHGLLRWLASRAIGGGVSGHIVHEGAVRISAGTELGDRVVVVSLTAREGEVPRSLLTAVSHLPGTMVALAEDNTRRLYVDASRRLPAGAAGTADRLSSEHRWLLGAPDFGHLRIGASDVGIDLTTLLRAGPDLEAPAPGAQIDSLSPVTPMPTIPVRVVMDRTAPGRVDAVLLSRDEVALAIPLLRAWPVQEVVFQLPGMEHSLILSPGGLPRPLPLGIPLALAPPGGLLVEEGMGFSPAVPIDARRDLFELRDGCLVAVTSAGAYRFDLETLAPAWHLWLGGARAVQDVVSPVVHHSLAELGAAAMAASRQADPRQHHAPADSIWRTFRPDDRTRMLREAQRAELQGRWAAAAELLEKIGEFGRAGRLYRRAAEAAGRSR